MLNRSIKPITTLIQSKNFRRASIIFLFHLLNFYISKGFLEGKIRRKVFNRKQKDFPERVWEDMVLEMRAILKSAKKSAERGISSRVVSRVSFILAQLFASGAKSREKLRKKYNYDSTPAFVLISPTNICNLKCKGCYAGENYDKYTLDFDVFDWVIREMKEKFGTRFFVLSGGEPLAYRSKGKTILDIFARHPDCFFLFFTNGTLITKKVAARLEKVANATPAISVEGFKEETETRRGPGVYEKVINAMKYLREKGVFFGVSFTPMRHNANLLFSDDCIKFWFDQQGATYGWYFQYMPIGVGPCPELMITPEQRERTWRKIWQYIRKGYFLADFWNCGSVSRGCISAARNGGYFHVLWNGDVTPCAFVPYKDRNKKINNVYSLIKNKKSIVDAINAPFFKEVREWQKRQQENAKGKGCSKCSGFGCGNLLMPCPIRDNSREFYKILQKTKAIPFDKGAVQYKKLIEKGIMPAYNDACHKKLDPLWKQYYVHS